ncbi:Formylglycine-generating enzyme, required for sulfatase activity, contains SUMF1/FGE domain [Candidatus Electrothrix aarhusensis]
MAKKRYAILIGSSRYPDEPGLTELRCPENDVDALDAVLCSPDFGCFTETFVFKNRPSHEILEKIETVLADAGRDDLVLIYFSGHGKTSIGPLCLATANTKMKALGSTSIPVAMIKTFFDSSDTRKKVLILDCCFSGSAGKIFTKGGVDDQLRVISEGEGIFIMTASATFQAAFEKEGDQYSLFTKHLVEGIRTGEADKDEDGLVDMQELYEYVHEKVQGEEGAQEPMKWDLHVKGKLVIARSGKASGKDWIHEAKIKLFELAAQERLTDSIVLEAVKILSVPKHKVTTGDRKCSVLVEQLVGEKISCPAFTEQWVETRYTDKAGEQEKKQTVPHVESKRNDVAVSETTRDSKPALTPVPQQGDTMTDEITGMELVYIPQGCFDMGSPPKEEGRRDDEGPVHRVCVDGFWMGRYAVTQGQWKQLMSENPSQFQRGENYSVERVSWEDAQKFIAKLNKQSVKKYRLPTEAEWEYACRAGSSGKYYGDDLDLLAWYAVNSGISTHPVGLKKPNAFALYDMSGNVWEWCSDWYGKNYYVSSPKNNPPGPTSGSRRVFRGGACNLNPSGIRSARRSGSTPGYCAYDLGFRLCFPPPGN